MSAFDTDHFSPNHEPAVPIAIIGMACRLPGSINSTSSLWEAILAKRATHTAIPSSRFTQSSFYHPEGIRPGSMNIPGGNFLDSSLAEFDASFFGVTPLEAHSMDPQQRLILEVAYECLENAGVDVESLRGKNVGVYVGAWTSDYENIQLKDPEARESRDGLAGWVTGTGRAILSNRVSYLLDLKGPSMTIDTGCSASAMALHVACQALRDPLSFTHSALVGGTNLMINPEMPISMTTLGILSTTGGCATFSAAANGYSRAEGINCVYLKRLDDALRDGDPIRAVIRSSAINSDGKTMGIAAPSAASQEAAIREAYAAASISDFSQTAYFECHGTGTLAGDPMEALAIGRVFGPGRDPEDPLYVGAVKTNLGHSEASSALSGVIKAVLALEAGKIPPNVGFEKPNPRIRFDAWRIKVPTEVVPWPANKSVKRASVSSYGYGGANAHFIIDNTEDYLRTAPENLHPKAIQHTQKSFLHNPVDSPSTSPTPHTRPFLLPFTAKNDDSLRAYISRLADALRSSSVNTAVPADLAYTLGSRRSTLPVRAYGVVSGTTNAELAEELKEISTSAECIPETADHRMVGFVFTGQGAQWAGMGVDLVEAYPVVRRTLEKLDTFLGALEDPPEWDIISEISKPAESSRINEPQFSQVLCTAIQIALVDLLRSWGIRPRAVVGHSSGEIAAAYASDSLTAADAITAAYYRGLVCSAAIATPDFPKGGMLAVGLSEDRVGQFLEPLTGRVGVACVNSPNSVTISGDEEAIQELEHALLEHDKNIFARRLKVPLAYHSHHMAILGPYYEQYLKQISPQFGRCPMYSSVTGDKYDGRKLVGAYWRQNLESTVLFVDAVYSMLTGGARVNTVLEIGPHSALASPLRDIRTALELPTDALMYIPTLIRGKNGAETVLDVAGKLFTHGYTGFDLEKVNGVELRCDKEGRVQVYEPRSVLVDLPSYVWDHSQEYWLECRRSKEWRFRKHLRHDLLGSRVPGINPTEPQWMNVMSTTNAPWIKEHMVRGNIVFPGTAYVCMAVEALTQYLESTNNFNPDNAFVLREITIQKPLILTVEQSMLADKGTEVFLSLKVEQHNIMDESKWYKFNIFSMGGGGETVKHCSGLICSDKRREAQNGRPEAAGSSVREIDDKAFYQVLDAAGFNYGPSFAGLKDLKARTDKLEMWGSMVKHESLRKLAKETAQEGEKKQEITEAGEPKGEIDDVADQSLVLHNNEPTESPGTSVATSTERSLESTSSSISTPVSESSGITSERHDGIDTTTLLSSFGAPQTAEMEMIQMLHMGKNSRDHIDSRYVVHPVNLDMMLQLLFGALHSGRPSAITDILVPIFIEELYISSPSPETDRFTVHSSAGLLPYVQIPISNTRLYDASGQEVVHVKNIQGMDVGHALRHTGQSNANPDILRLHWVPDYNFINQNNYHQVINVEPTDTTADDNLQRFVKLMAADVNDRTKEIIPTQPHLHRYRSLLSELLDPATPETSTSSQDRKAEIQRLAREVTKTIQGEMAYAVYQRIDSLLSGELQAVDVFSQDDMWNRLNNSADLIQPNEKLSNLYSNKYSKSDVLEIGAGTGGGTLALLKGCTRDAGSGVREQMYHSYTFTDISPQYVTSGREKFGSLYTGMEFRTLDIDLDPVEQGFNNTYDIVHAVNVLYATRNIKSSLENIGKLLKPGGRLHLTDFARTRTGKFDALCFALGVSEDWWRAEETQRAQSPILSLDDWVEALQDSGFQTNFILSDGINSTGCLSIIATHAAGSETIAPTLKPPQHRPSITVLHRTPSTPAIDSILQALKTELGSHELIPTPFDSLTLPLSSNIVLSLLEFDEPMLANITPPEFDKLKHLTLETQQPILWVTCGSQLAARNPAGAMITGFARTLRNERVTLDLNLLDLSSADIEGKARHIGSVLESILIRVRTAEDTTRASDSYPDWEFCEYMGIIHVPRLVLDNETRAKYAPNRDHPSKMEPYRQNKNLSLVCTQRGMLSSLVFEERESVPKLSPGYVELEPDAFGLNFEDVATAMGIIPFPTIGIECSGTIRRVGPGVSHIAVGDRVFTVSPNEFSNRFTLPAMLCTKLPQNVDQAAFTGSLVVYATVIRALLHVARMEKGERVLIHSAAGGVGNAAIQLCKFIGAEIFATCGNAEKRKFLTETHRIPDDHIFSSRDTSFREGIMQVTKGEGVDIILNSLSGELLHESWKCLAPCGRFIEIGKRDMLLSGKLDMMGFMKNTTYAAVDLAGIFTGGSKLIGKLLGDVQGMYQRGEISPIAPVTKYSISDVEQAFRHMSAGTHIGKLVLVVDSDPKAEQLVKVIHKPRSVRFDPEGTYLLVGGLGGIGSSLAVWMAEKGAKHLCFMSRTGASTEDAKKALDTIAALGCQVQLLQCDVGDADSVEESLASVTRRIRGIVHAAMSLKDAMFDTMEYADFITPFRSKVNGLLNLQQTLSQPRYEPLDFFIVLSSISGILGTQGQSNYAAAGTFEDAFVRTRQNLGQHACVIDLGVVTNVGYVSKNPELERKLKQSGIGAYNERQVHQLFRIALGTGLQEGYSHDRQAPAGQCLANSQIVTGVNIQGPDIRKLQESEWFKDPKWSILDSTAAALGPDLGTTGAGDADDITMQLIQNLKDGDTRPADEVIDDISKAIIRKTSAMTGIPATDILPAHPLTRYGMDSLVAVEMRNWLFKVTTVELKVADIMGSSSIRNLAEKIHNALMEKRGKKGN